MAAAIAALTLMLAMMRLGGFIDWPWRWVTAPLWASGLVLIAGWLVFLITMSLAIHRRETGLGAASKGAAEKDD